MKQFIYLIGLLLIFVSLSKANASTGRYKYNGSDIVKYGLTAHKTEYVLRSLDNSINAWYPGTSRTLRYHDYQYKKVKGLKGNTDCSGLVSKAMRIGRYRAPTEHYRWAPGTSILHEMAMGRSDRGSKGLFYAKYSGKIARGSAVLKVVKHGDAFLRTGSPYGHTLLYNGYNSNGTISTIEAKCTKCGTGRFSKSENGVTKTYKVLRSKFINHNVNNKKKVYTTANASSKVTTFGAAKEEEKEKQYEEKEGPGKRPTGMVDYVVKASDNGWTIAQDHGIKWEDLKKANPDVDFNRMGPGLVIKLPFDGVPENQEPVKETTKDYVVKASDNGWTIAQDHGIKWEDLKKANPDVDFNRMRPGLIIKLPIAEQAEVEGPTETEEPAKETTKDYIVKASDNGWTIAQDHGVKWLDLKNANPDVDWTRMRPGLVVKIPLNGSTSVDSKKYHTVKRRETTWSIGKKYGKTVKEMKSMNPILRRDPYLKVGQRLRVK